MIVSRITTINNFATNEFPIGWVVREKFNEGKAVGLEFGCYLKEDVFISVPIHFSLKDKLVPMAFNSNPMYKYYAIPQDMELAVSKYTNKKGKECPILVAPNKERGVNPTFIACIARDEATPSVITDVTIGDGAEVIRKYVDKDRSVIGIIAFKTDTGVINPSVTMHVETGVVGGNTINTFDYTFETMAPSTTSDTITTDYKVKTNFINLPTFLDEKKDVTENTNKSERNHNDRRPNNNGRKFNNNDRRFMKKN